MKPLSFTQAELVETIEHNINYKANPVFIVEQNPIFFESSIKKFKEAQSTKKIQKKRRKVSSFTKSEDRLILTLVRKIGPKFDIISKQFHNKTLNMVKNRFYKVLRYQDMDNIRPNDQYSNIQESLQNSGFCPEIKEIMNKFLQDFQSIKLHV